MAAFRTRLPDLAVIDVGLADEPDGGFTLCRDLRALSPTLPIIFLSARDSDFDIVAGTAHRRRRLPDQGREPAPAHGAHRGAVPAQRPARGAAGERGRARARRADARSEAADRDVARRPVPLTLTEFWMVHSLARHPGHVKDRER